jgi:capsular polysaccharide biosynthesis protein
MELRREQTVYAGSEPADERLLLLLFLKKLPVLCLIIVLGTGILMGAYCLRYLAFGDPVTYKATSYFQIHYEIPLSESDYYLNDYTWNIYIHSDTVTDPVLERLQAAGTTLTKEQLIAKTEAEMESDLSVLTLHASSYDAEEAMTIETALQAEMAENFRGINDGVRELELIDSAKLSEEHPDVRPVRAFVLSALLMAFFTFVIWLIREVSADSIYLPKTLRRRYGLPAIGTEESDVLAAHLEYLFRDKERIGIVPATEDLDPVEVREELVRILDGKAPAGERMTAMPAPLLCQEAAEAMRKMDGILLAIPAGRHAGKPLERVLEFLETQEIPVTAAVLWEADEKLVRNYYRIGGTEEK